MKNEHQLIEESDELLSIAEKIQDETYPLQEREALLKQLENSYHQWYRSALVLFDRRQNGKERQLFEQEYSGSIWSGKILKFITSGLEPSPLYIPDNPLTSKWAYIYKGAFKEPLIKQCNLLTSLEASYSDAVTHKEDSTWNITVCRVFKVFIEKADNAETTNEKKLTYEYLAIFLIGAIDGLSIIGHDHRGASEEVDLWVTNEAKDGFWQKAGHVFIVECKNWKEPVGVQQIRNLKGIMDEKHVKFAILLSKNGITGDKWHDAMDIIRKAVKNDVHIVVLDHTDLLEISQGLHPTEKIKQKFYDLLMSS